ncbi:unnamed protein product [Phaedon cochleariae]|uniref:Coiled-coil domain-containing protein n=1 Tax=Phaedon cochleariae TaxID=80249 RepID=A0A9P0GS64_PHACE|nr:unnamed protein product [Phaedon cochleariae]
MPKKFPSENTKAAAARERKQQVKDEAVAKKQKDIDDAYWTDNDKQVQKKQQKKDAEEKKRIEALQRKAEAKALLEKEASEVIKKVSKPAPPVKLTRAQIESKVTAKVPNLVKAENKIEIHLDIPLEENINRLQIDGEEARTVDEAITLLGTKEDSDKHPEKRMKAAYNAFEERRLKELKIENPTLRLSQLKQMIFKEWQKSPENPLNNQ